MPIQDLAGNLFETQSSPMIGFMAPTVPSLKRELSLRMYKFLIEGIREEDQTKGARFVERFLEGPQQVWGRIDATMRSLPDMWSVTKCDDRFLPYLKWIVGWTSELDHITDDLDVVTLRRLIAASVPFWKIRGTEDALTEILQLTTAANVRVLTWFDLRYISDETGLGEDHEGHDPWMIELPGPDGYTENQMNVRIVDDGSLNRRLVRNLVKLTRPGGERVTISYIGFLDLFTTDDDSSQWTEVVGTVPPVVANGVMTLGSDPEISVYANPAAASSWENYTFGVKLRGGGPVVEFYRTSDGDSYYVLLIPSSNTITLYKIVAGVSEVIAVTSTFYPLDALPGYGSIGDGGWILHEDVFYVLRVTATPEAGATRITVWLDGNLAINVLDAAHSHGTIGLNGTFSGIPIEVSEVEMFFNPLEEDFIDITRGIEAPEE